MFQTSLNKVKFVKQRAAGGNTQGHTMYLLKKYFTGKLKVCKQEDSWTDIKQYASYLGGKIVKPSKTYCEYLKLFQISVKAETFF